MLDMENGSSLHPPLAAMALVFRDAEGEINPDFVAAAAKAIAADDAAALRALVEDLHPSDLGALLEALEPDDRPRLIELLGPDFNFAALTEVDDSVREDILEELETETVVEGVRELDPRLVELVPGQTVVPDPTFTLRPRNGVKVLLWPR